MTIDEKYGSVKKFYEDNYRGIYFKKRPSDTTIQFLYQEKEKLLASWAIYKERARPSLVRIIRNN